MWIWDALVAGGTLLLAGATFYMAREMKKAREQSLRPYLIILNPIYRYEFRWIPSENLSPIIRPELSAGQQSIYPSQLPVFRLKNIGNAPAKNIKLSWSIDSNRDELQKNSFLVACNLQFDTDFFSMSSEANGISIKCANHDDSMVDYCIASPTNDFIEPIDIPVSISGCFDLVILGLSRPSDTDILQCPNINLFVTYDDLDGNTYKRQFVISSTLRFLPDNISSQTNSVEAKFFNAANIRGGITFHVKDVSMAKYCCC